MSESNNSIRGIRYEISRPVRSPYDGHYYQRVRQVDENGNLVGIGEQVHRSAKPGSADGLVGRSIDVVKLGKLTGNVGKMAFGYVLGNRRAMAEAATTIAHDLPAGLTRDYKSWPGTERPWERPFDWQTGGSPVDFVPGAASDEIGDRRGIGSWPDSFRYMPQNRKKDAWAKVPVPDLSVPSPRRPEWNDTFVRDSAAAAGIPGRNNVFEYGFPEPDSGTSSSRATLGRTSAPQLDSANFTGGLPGRIAALTGIDASGAMWPSIRNQPPADVFGTGAPPLRLLPPAPQSAPAGLAGLIQEYLRSN